jgi:alpha/beta superfamily hydrolase
MKNEDLATTRIEEATKRIPSIGLLGFAVGSVVASATLMALGRKNAALFIGQWAPTVMSFAIYNKIVKTFSAPYDEDQRLKHGDNASLIKSADELRMQEPLRPLS